MQLMKNKRENKYIFNNKNFEIGDFITDPIGIKR